MRRFSPYVRLYSIIALLFAFGIAWAVGPITTKAQPPAPEKVKGREDPRDAPGKVTPPPRVPLAFNRLYDYPELVEALQRLVAAHPDWLTLRSIGKSVEGRDLWCVTINNPRTGSDLSKPAMYVDGNVHGNEVQAAETCLYLIWYLMENQGRVKKLRELLDERAFYVIPTVNPDGRAYWFNGPNTVNSSRSGKSPLDNDRDGLTDEDGYDDLNGDGQITLMRRKRRGGLWKLSPTDPRLLVRARADEIGEYDQLGLEGIDNDGDGEINEDPPGGYDMNRNYPADWQPNHVQFGAGPFPLCWPETRAVADFVRSHPNIAGVQSFHNAGGMILRGPGHPSRAAQYPDADDRVAKELGDIGARMIPGYNNWVIHRDLYPVHGGFVTWTYEHLGIFSFTNELWTEKKLLGAPGGPPAAAPGAGAGQSDELFASDLLLQGAAFVEWTKVEHPLYGSIEVGGFVKQTDRVPPPFLIEEDCHRNAAFVLFHADQMPRAVWEEVTVERLEPLTHAVTASIRNTRRMPTRSQQSVQRSVGVPDQISCAGAGLTVVGSGLVTDPDTREVEAAKSHPETYRLAGGIPGGGVTRVRFFVRGRGTATLRYVSRQAGTLTKTVTLGE